MIVRTFVDSNILIYAHDADAGFWQRPHLKNWWNSGLPAVLLSTQVLQEFYVNVTRKIKAPLSPGAAREVVRDYPPWLESPNTPATVSRVSEFAEIWQVSFWDGMILAAAEQNRAERLLTEDLSHRERIAGIEILNPFR